MTPTRGEVEYVREPALRGYLAVNEARRMPVLADVDLRLTYAIGEDIDEVWSALFGMLEPACDETITPRDAYTSIRERKALAWIISDAEEIIAAAVTREDERDDHRWLNVVLLGGRDWHLWAPMLHAEFTRHARARGCEAVTAHVRRGLSKWLARLGWRERQIHMEYRCDG